MEREDKSILVFILPKYLTKKTQIPNKNPILRGAFLVSVSVETGGRDRDRDSNFFRVRDRDRDLEMAESLGLGLDLVSVSSNPNLNIWIEWIYGFWPYGHSTFSWVENAQFSYPN
jgi:hypothetical protein